MTDRIRGIVKSSLLLAAIEIVPHELLDLIPVRPVGEPVTASRTSLGVDRDLAWALADVIETSSVDGEWPPDRLAIIALEISMRPTVVLRSRTDQRLLQLLNRRMNAIAARNVIVALAPADRRGRIDQGALTDLLDAPMLPAKQDVERAIADWLA